MFSRKGIFLAVLAVAVVSAMSLCAGCKKGGNVVKIAIIAPMTGDEAAMGQGMKNGAALAVEQANLRDDVKKKGLTFELVAVDDRSNPTEAVNGATQIISDPKILGVVGHLDSGCSIPASQKYNIKNLIMISPASTNPKLTLQGYKNVFRVCTTDAVQGPFTADYLYNKRGLRSVAVMHNKTPYGQGLADSFKEQFIKDGGQVTAYEGISLGDKDFNAVLTKIKGTAPQAIFYGGVYSEAGLVSKQSKELGLNVPLVAGDGTFSPEFMKIGGKATEGDIVTMFGPPFEKLPTAKEFVESYKKKFPNTAFQPYDAYTFDATNIIIDAVMNVGKDRSKIVEYVAKGKFNGVLGETSFDENGDTLNKVITPYVVTNGKFEPAD